MASTKGEAERDSIGDAGSLPGEALLALDNVAVAVLRGPGFRLALANERFLRLTGRQRSNQEMTGGESGLPIGRDILEAAWRSSDPLRLRAHPVQVGADRQAWNFDLVPLPPDDAGERGILVVGNDATPTVQPATHAGDQARLLDAIMSYAPAGITVAVGGTITRSSDYARSLRPRPLAFLSAAPIGQIGDAYETRDLATGARIPTEELPLARAALRGEVVRGAELLITVEGGAQLPIHCDAGPIRDEAGGVVGGVVVWQDIRRLKDAEAALKSALEGKDALLRELSHRVKNNFQMVSALLQLQASEAPDARVRDSLQQAVWRIHALANIHERLYRRDHFDGLVDLDVAIEQLCQNLRAASGERVRLELHLRPLVVSGDSGFPLLLIVNELIGSAYTHGFPEDLGGTVTVRLGVQDGAVGELTVSHDGIAQPVEAGQRRSLGKNLVEMMTRQVGGQLQRDGLSVTIHFPV